MDKIRINLEITKDMLRKLDAALAPNKQSRADFIRAAIAQAIINSLSPGTASLNRRKGLAVSLCPTASPPLQGRE
jgi:metal-responsive CopG/Arc/MetJ family transcriptional regulator